MRTIDILTLSISAVIVACHRPITLRVETPDVSPAHLRTQVVKGDKPTAPTQCDTPCEIKIPHGSEHQVNLEAPGYYPAQFNISYDNARVTAAVQDDECVLRVPLRRRPATPVATPKDDPSR